MEAGASLPRPQATLHGTLHTHTLTAGSLLPSKCRSPAHGRSTPTSSSLPAPPCSSALSCSSALRRRLVPHKPPWRSERKSKTRVTTRSLKATTAQCRLLGIYKQAFIKGFIDHLRRDLINCAFKKKLRIRKMGKITTAVHVSCLACVLTPGQ